MARRYEMTRADYESLNRKALWFNLVIMAIAAASIITLFLTNFWKVSVKFEMSESMLNDILSIVSEDESTEILNDIDPEIFNDLSIEASLSVETDVLLTSIAGGGKATAKKLISSVVTDLSRQAADIMGAVLKPLTKTIIAAVLDDIEEQLSTNLGENFVNDLNLEGVEDIINMIVDGTTEDDLKVEIKNFIENMLGDAGLNNEDINKLMDGGEAGEEGINGIVDEIVGGMSENIGVEGEGGETIISFDQVITKLAGEAFGFDTKNMSSEDVADELAAYLVEQMPEEAVSIIHYGVLSLAGLLLMAVISWSLLFLFGFIRIFTKKKILYMGLARGFGILPYILLVIIPWIGFLIANAILGSEFLMTGLSFKVSSVGLLVSFVGACVLALLKWIRYGRIKKRIKYAVITNDNFNENPEVSFEDFNNSSNERRKSNPGNSGENFNDFNNDYNSRNSNGSNSGNSDENFNNFNNDYNSRNSNGSNSGNSDENFW